MDARDLALRSGAFDFVASFEVIEHFEEQARFLGELNRVLAPGGHALLSTPNAEIEMLHLRRHGRGNPYHVASLHPAEFRDLLEAHFARVQLFGQRGTGGRIHSLLKALDLWNLRHRLIPPSRQRRVRNVLRPERGGPSFDDFGIGPGLIRQSSTILGLCRKSGDG